MDTNVPRVASVVREAHLRDYWRIVWQGRWTVLALFCIVVGLTAIWTFRQTPVYVATATVEIQPQARKVLSGQDASGLGAAGFGWFAEEKYHNTQVEIIKSRDVAGRVVRLLDLASHPTFEGSSDPVEDFRTMIQVDPRRETGLIEISIAGTDREEIAQWVNAVASVYGDRNFEKARQNLDKAVATIREQIDSLQAELTQAEEVRIGSLERNEIFNSDSQTEIVRQNIAKFNSELTAAHIELNRLGGALRRVREMKANGQDLTGVRELAEDEALQNLSRDRVTVERELEALRVELRPNHPSFEKKKGELAKVQRGVDERIAVLVESLENDFERAQKSAEYLREQIGQAEEFSLKVAKATSRYDIVKTDADVKKRIFDLISKTMNEVQLGAELLTNNVTVLDQAIPPLHPITPRKKFNLFFGSVFGLFLGVAAVFFLDYLDNTIRTPEDVEKFLNLSVLGVVPKMRETGLGNRAVREAYQSLRTSIIFSSKNRQRKVILITSNGPREGKSSTVANVGQTLAAAGDRVIILDCDLRRPRQHVLHKLERENGLTNYLSAATDDHDWTQYVKSSVPPNLHLLTSGPIPPSPPELLGNDRLKDLLTALRGRYDWILIDSPPAASLADASLLASVVDMIVMVIQHNRTDRDLVIKTLQQLRSVNPSVAGVVLNNVDIDRSYNKDYYYSGYYYSEEDEDKEKRGRKKRVESKAQAG